MKKRVLIISLFALVFALVSAVFAFGATCESLNMRVCDSTPNSAIGFGAVDICGNCHPCGASDGVCPEDFYSSVTSQQGNCRLCPDPDCSSYVTGYVKAGPYPVRSGAEIYASYPMNNTVKIAETDSEGLYESVGFAPVPSGRIQLYAVYEDYDSEQVFIDLTRGGSHEANISVQAGSCEADCTGVGPFLTTCRAGCQGVNGCQFATAGLADVARYGDADALLDPLLVANYCNGKDVNDNVTLTINETLTHRWVIQCCNSTKRVSNTKDTSEYIEQDELIKSLSDHRTRVRYNGQWVELVVKHYVVEE